MKFQDSYLLFGNNNQKQILPKLTLLVIFAIFIFSVTPLSYPLFGSSLLRINKPNQSSSSANLSTTHVKKCDIFSGEWMPNPEAPYYTNRTCFAIREQQNCIKYGRPDSEFMKWRWKPYECELPIFDPFKFLHILNGKSMAFVGDSLARNHMQSMICLLLRVEWPTSDDSFMRWKFPSYNFTIVSFWTPHLVRTQQANSNGSSHNGLFNLYLDEVDEKWATQIEEFDYVILNGGHWFFQSMMLYERLKIVGCNNCQLENVTDLTMYYGFRKAFRTTFKAINRLKNFKGVTFLSTFSPPHYENGLWDSGGNCVRTKPYRSNETQLQEMYLELYMIQLEEFRMAEKEARKKGLKFRLLDTTQAMLLRPDGHPSRYGHWPHENVTMYNDCVHWCLPGPIDTWSDFLLELLKMDSL